MEADEDGALSFVITSTGTNTNQSSAVISSQVEDEAEMATEQDDDSLRMCTSYE